jgi:predicted ATPase
VRIGIHTGEPLVEEEGYVGIDVHRAARIAHIGYGGQVLLSETSTSLIRDDLPDGVTLKDLGEHWLKNISHPERIHQLIIKDLPSEFPHLTSLEARPNNLPIQPTPFVGRKDELEALETLISKRDNRLISIIGTGGMGKTRLAIAAAEQQLHALISSNGKEEPRFPDGVFFVRLAPLDVTEAIIPAIAEATGFQFYEEVDSKKQLLDFFREKQLLLLMDNFEHLMKGVTLLSELVQASSKVKFLVTSREKLNLRGEVTYPLSGMRFPREEELPDIFSKDETYSAVELFKQCANRMNPSFTPDDDEMKSIGTICRLVEGMPLGVELAATWVEMLTPGEIVSEIQSSLDFLEAETHDTPERHKSIRAVFDYTWKLLSEEEKEILKKISVFRGGFTSEAAREVVGASLKQLLRLVNKFLLQRSEGRFDIHELLRVYAKEKMNRDEDEIVRYHHCDYFSDLLKEREAQIWGGQQEEVLREIDNLRAAWKWAYQNNRYRVIRKSTLGFQELFTVQGWNSEGRDIYEHAYAALMPRLPLQRGISV